MSNVLLTGGLGYIGSHAAIALTDAGHDVALYDNLANSKKSILDLLETITCKRFPFVEGDVRDTAMLEKTLKAYHIDAVIHFAGLKAVGESIDKALEYYDCNVSGTISLVKAMRTARVKTLVFSSSATVYGEPQYLPLDEAHPTSATNPYGRSKLHIEEMLADVAKSEASWRIACLRYFNPIGAHESGLIGEDPNDVPNNLMPYIARVASGKLPQIAVFGNDYNTPDGTGVRDYIHVMDLAEGHCAGLRFLQNHTGWHAINLGAGIGYSVLEMISAFETASRCIIPYSIAPRRSGDIATCYAQIDKAKKLLHWQAKRSLQNMCETIWNFENSSA